MGKLKFLVAGGLTVLTFVATAIHAGGGLANPAPTQLSEMFRLATSSEFAVVGRVVSSRPIAKRLSQQELSQLDDLSKTLGGVLYTIKVEDVVISRDDFIDSGPKQKITGGDIFIFKKRDASFFRGESYDQGQKYLIFLTPLPGLDQLVKEYTLAEGETYYEAFEGKKGLVVLVNDSLPLLVRLRQLGGAVKPDDPQQKLKRLRALTQSNDAELRQAAREAIRMIQERLRR